MTNLIDEDFARRNGLKLIKKDVPLKCISYDESPGPEVAWKWRGKIQIQGQDEEREDCKVLLNVSKLGNHDLFIGLPWMKLIGCFLELSEGGSFMTIGTMLIKTLPMSEKSHKTLDCEIPSSESFHSSSFLSPSSSTASSVYRSCEIKLKDINDKKLLTNLFPDQILSPSLEKICNK